MNNGDITKYIVAELRKFRDRNDIISEVCERCGMKWADAQQFVEQVQSEHAAEITGLHNPYLVVFGIGMIIVGLGLLIGPFVVGLLAGPSAAVVLFAVLENFILLAPLLIIGGAIELLSLAVHKQ